jgi:two-component system CheB/CheR fusion protein
MPIVGIGASAGGVDALRQFFGALPTDLASSSPEASREDSSPEDTSSEDAPGEADRGEASGSAYVVVLHLSPTAESDLVDILQDVTRLRVERAADGQRARRGTVYVCAPGQRLTLDEGRLHVEKVTEPHDPLSIDRFFRSLAADQGENAVGIVLSGSGSDGTLGLRAIKEAGGVAMVQSPDEAEHPRMPESALATGLVDLSLPVAQLAENLAAYRDRAGAIQVPKDEAVLGEDARSTLARIFDVLHQATGFDFSGYKRSTVLRRLERRLQLSGRETLEGYLDLLQSNAEETRALQKDLLISVTNFFRDPDAFQALEETVVPALFDGKSAGDSVRVWVPGCATGEEAYSLAMLLVEEAERAGTAAPDLQIFATDVNEDALAFGRQGLYPKAIETDVSAERLDRFFQRQDDGYQINHGLRDHVLFAKHNLLEDPPFSDLDLISCRNLLIYLEQKLQHRAYRLLHYGLRDRGHLFLGRSEALGQADELFEATDASNNILRARDRPQQSGPRSAGASFLQWRMRPGADTRRTGSEKGAGRRAGSASMPLGRSPGDGDSSGHEETPRTVHRRALMEEVASVLVTEGRKIVHVSGAADRYLQFGEGPPTSDLVDCVPDAVRHQLRSALYRAFDDGEATHRTGIELQIEGEPRHLALSVRPLESGGTRYAHVRFEDLAAPGSGDQVGETSDSDREAELRAELEHTRKQLQATAEEHEAVAEEMETANEELLSMNEELQSKNEELETNKEELQSVNEELKATNRELKSRIEEVRRSKGALENLMAATEIATLFLDPDLCIRRFTPAAAELFDLSESDLGRHLGDLTKGFDRGDLLAEARRAFRDARPVEREVRRGPEEWHLARLRPYRTVDGEVTGVVLTLVDITQRRLLERQVVNTAEKVRRQIGQDLHDVLSSDLTALAMKLDNYRDRLDGTADFDLSPLRDMAEHAREAANRARTLSHALVPVALQEEHLAAALENLCREQADLTELSVAFEGNREERLPRNKETAAHLYRIAREAVVNARRHSGCDNIRVRLGRTNGTLEMVVQDDGIGLPEDVDEARGLGMRTMRYRANLVGASLSFEPGLDEGESSDGGADGPGTLLRCTLSLPEAKAE